MLMKHKEHGWHQASGLDIDEMKKNGWEESSQEEWNKVIAEKKKKDTIVEEAVIIELQQEARGKPGRKPKNYQ